MNKRNLKQLIKEAGFTQIYLARLWRVSATTFSLWVNNHRKVSDKKKEVEDFLKDQIKKNAA